MAFEVKLTPSAEKVLRDLEQKNVKKFRKVGKTLGLLAQTPKYPGLNSHKYESQQGPNGEALWEAYVENNTPAALRIFWCYGPDPGTITVLAITPHP